MLNESFVALLVIIIIPITSISDYRCLSVPLIALNGIDEPLSNARSGNRWHPRTAFSIFRPDLDVFGVTVGEHTRPWGNKGQTAMTYKLVEFVVVLESDTHASVTKNDLSGEVHRAPGGVNTLS